MTQIEALTQCLMLALVAPDDQKAQKALDQLNEAGDTLEQTNIIYRLIQFNLR